MSQNSLLAQYIQTYSESMETIPCPLILLNDQGEPVYANSAAQGFVECCENGTLAFPTRSRLIISEIKRALKNQTEINSIRTLYNRVLGRDIIYQVQIEPYFVEAKLLGLRLTLSPDMEKIFKDIESHQAVYSDTIKNLINERNIQGTFISAIFDLSPVGITIFNSKLQLLRINQEAQNILGNSRPGIIGQPCRQFFKCHENFGECPALIENTVPYNSEIECRASVDDEGKTILRSVIKQAIDNDFLIYEFFVDITHQKKAIEEIETNLKTKNRFFANMSHELRTPLNAIVGLSDLLALDAKSVSENAPTVLPQEFVENIETVQNEGEHLLQIIDDILMLAKLESDSLSIKMSEVNMCQFLEELSQSARVLSAKNNNRFVLNNQTSMQSLTTDPLRLKQVLINLISNAAKFTHDGVIELMVRAESTSIVLQVKDSGIGIPVDKLESIFHAFEQVDSSTTRHYGGTGLGLSICLNLIKQFGGNISVDSQPGQGSVFSVYLPLMMEKAA
ncbi:MAG: ATP-binding protein [Gammaproteobacteria bacterium]|nr:ATP-binding protein [Gammaproteobacteria bacterium]